MLKTDKEYQEKGFIINESKTPWEEKAPETIEEPIISESTIKNHLTIQQIVYRISYLNGNLIPYLNSLNNYNLIYKKENDRITKELQEKNKELEELILLRDKIKKININK